MTPPFKIQYDEKDYSQPGPMGQSIDDFFAAKADVHIERMDDNNYWIGMDLPDGTNIRFWIGHRNPKARVNAYVEIEAPAPKVTMPQQRCARCQTDKPRTAFPDSEWNKRPELKRYCTDCKRAPRNAKIDPNLTWRKMMHTNYEQDTQVKSQAKTGKRFFAPHP